MTSSLRISLSLALLLCANNLRAQYRPADDFFNGGAQLYISNNIPAALERTEAGLKIYPNDDKLQKLEKLLKQQQQSQSQQNQQQQQQESQNQQSKNDQQKNQQNQNQQQQNSQQKKQDQQNQSKSDQQKKEDQQKQQAQNASKDQQPKEDQKQSGEQAKAGEISPEEAKRLLDAQKGNEQLLRWRPPEKPHDPNRPVKDW
jgi:Ca-activated chloride channel family protein